MADSSTFFNFYRVAQTPRQRSRSTLLEIIRTLLTILLMTLMIDLAVVFLMPDGLEMLKSTYRQEIAYLNANIDEHGTELITHWVNTVHDWVFVKTGIRQALHTNGSSIVGNIVSGLWPAFQGALIGFQIFLIRLSVIALMTPFLLLLMVIAASDGYLQWYLRRSSGARESAFIYHRSKRIFSWSLFSCLFLYLVPPFSVNPVWVFIPLTLLIAFFTRLTIQYFKKHL